MRDGVTYTELRIDQCFPLYLERDTTETWIRDLMESFSGKLKGVTGPGIHGYCVGAHLSSVVEIYGTEWSSRGPPTVDVFGERGD